MRSNVKIFAISALVINKENSVTAERDTLSLKNVSLTWKYPKLKAFGGLMKSLVRNHILCYNATSYGRYITTEVFLQLLINSSLP